MLELAHEELTNLGYLTAAYMMGPTHVDRVLAWVDELEGRGVRQSWLVAARAEALAMTGHIDQARAILAELQAQLVERGATLALVRRLGMMFDVEMLAGDFDAAASIADEHCRLLDERGERAGQSTAVANLGQALFALGRLDEAEEAAARAAELGASDDIATQALWRQVRAKVLARHGEYAEAEKLASDAVALAETTDCLEFQGDAFADLGTVIALAGNRSEAAKVLGEAVGRYERKGNVVAAERTKAQLVSLGP